MPDDLFKGKKDKIVSFRCSESLYQTLSDIEKYHSDKRITISDLCHKYVVNGVKQESMELLYLKHGLDILFSPK